MGEFYRSPEHAVTQPIEGAVEVLRELQQNIGGIFVITSRPESVSAETFAWLEKHFPSLLGDVHFTSHFYHTETKTTKGEVCRTLGVDVFVDDAPFHAEDVAAVVEKVLLFDRPWNRSYVPTLPNVRRVHSWSEIRTLLGENV